MSSEWVNEEKPADCLARRSSIYDVYSGTKQILKATKSLLVYLASSLFVTLIPNTFEFAGAVLFYKYREMTLRVNFQLIVLFVCFSLHLCVSDSLLCYSTNYSTIDFSFRLLAKLNSRLKDPVVRRDLEVLTGFKRKTFSTRRKNRPVILLHIFTIFGQR